METEEALEKVLAVVRESSTELESSRLTWHSTKQQQLDSALLDMDRLLRDNHDLVEENKHLHHENCGLLQLLEKKDHNNTLYQNRDSIGPSTHEERWNLQELERINLHLQAELDRHLTESTTFKQHLNHVRDEMDQVKIEVAIRAGQVIEQKLERQTYERNINATQNERTNLLRNIGH
jgi:hypothetical protein